MTEHDARLFPRLDPPSGGLERLLARRRVRTEPASPWLLATAAGSGACAALLALAVRPALPDTPSLDRLRGVAPSGATLVLADPDARAQALVVRPGVRVYWTASLRAD